MKKEKTFYISLLLIGMIAIISGIYFISVKENSSSLKDILPAIFLLIMSFTLIILDEITKRRNK